MRARPTPTEERMTWQIVAVVGAVSALSALIAWAIAWTKVSTEREYTRREWDRLRMQDHQVCQYRCEICGSKKA